MDQKVDTKQLSSGFSASNHLAILEAVLNTANHTFIGIMTFYLTWYCFHVGFNELITWHVFLATSGYQLLMAEGMMSLYSKNSFTLLNTKSTKRTIHWILQSLGIIFALAGTIIEIYSKWGRVHFQSNHAILGLVSIVLLLITFFNGILALYSVELKSYIKPLYSKIFHNLLSIAAFAIGMASIIDGYWTKRFIITNDPGDVRYWMIAFCIIVIFLTAIGPLKNLYAQIKTAFF